MLSHGYYDAYYLKAQKVRRLIADDFLRAFEKCDVIIGPTTPTTAFKLGDKTDDPVKMYLNDIFTIAANLAGAPAMSIPCGFDDRGLPVGMQLKGNYFGEAQLLNVAHQFQQATDWHRRACRRGDSAHDAHEQWEVVIGLETHAQLSTRVEDIFRRVDGVRRRAEHAGLRGRHRAAGRAAGAEQGRSRARDPLRARGRRDDQPAQRLRAQELLLSRTCPRATRSASTRCRSCRAATSRSCRRRAARSRCG